MTTTQASKISQLPRPIRDQINHRLLNQEPAEAIIRWVHTLTDVWKIIRQQFNNQQITLQDLSEWRLTGYAEWKLQQNYGPNVPNPELTTDGQLNTSSRRVVDHLSEVVAGCLAQFMHHWNGDVTPEFNAKLRVLSHLTRDICALRKSEHNAARLKLDEAKFAARQKQSDEAMEAKFMQMLDQPGIREQVLAHYANQPSPDPRPETPDPSLPGSESGSIKPNQASSATPAASDRPIPPVHPVHSVHSAADDSPEAPDIYSRPNQTKSTRKPQKEEPIVRGFLSQVNYDAQLRRNDVHY